MTKICFNCNHYKEDYCTKHNKKMVHIDTCSKFEKLISKGTEKLLNHVKKHGNKKKPRNILEISDKIRELRNEYSRCMRHGLEPTEEQREGASEYRRIHRLQNKALYKKNIVKHREFMRVKTGVKKTRV